MASSNSLLAQVLRTKLIPWTQDGLSERTVIGTRQQLKAHPDAEIAITPTNLIGPRVVNKGGHQFAYFKIFGHSVQKYKKAFSHS